MSEAVPKVDVDFHPLQASLPPTPPHCNPNPNLILSPNQELGAALGLGMMGGGVALTNKILYRNDIATEDTVGMINYHIWT